MWQQKQDLKRDLKHTIWLDNHWLCDKSTDDLRGWGRMSWPVVGRSRRFRKWNIYFSMFICILSFIHLTSLYTIYSIWWISLHWIVYNGCIAHKQHLSSSILIKYECWYFGLLACFKWWPKINKWMKNERTKWNNERKKERKNAFIVLYKKEKKEKEKCRMK